MQTDAGKEKPYRLNTGVVVFNSRGKVLVGDRIQYPEKFQFPQGGLESGEDPLEGALRELAEETGLELPPEPADEIKDWLTYEFPKDIPDHLQKFKGQKQKWFFFHWDGDIEMLDPNTQFQEFRTLKWDDFENVYEQIVDFKKDTYKRLFEEGKKIIENHLKLKKII